MASAPQTEGERVLLTGGQGFFGAWIIKQLFAEGSDVLVCDLAQADGILSQVLSADELAKLKRVYGDVTDWDFMSKTVMEFKPTAIIHLAGLQIPTCRARPMLGAKVNVLGTINVFEAAKALGESQDNKFPRIVYASSAAVCGPSADYAETPVPDDFYHKPRTLYGVFKLCNEGTARLYFQDYKMSSVGLRPYTCYGVGREVGLTSAPTKAIKAAVLGRDYEITFSGNTGFSYVEDIARIFIGCARAPVDGAPVHNVRGHMVSVDTFIKHLEDALPEAKGKIKCSGNELTIMADTDESGLQALLKTVPAPFDIKEPFPMPLADTILATAKHFRMLQAEGRLTDKDL